MNGKSLKSNIQMRKLKKWDFFALLVENITKIYRSAYGADAPFQYSKIPTNESEKRCELTDDVCIIDDKDFFIKGNLFINVENNEDFSWNVWVQIPKKDFKR